MSQIIGSIIGAVLKIPQYRRGAKIPTPGQFAPRDIWYAGIFPCHAVTQEAYEFQAEATQYPIENVAVYSDHVLLRPTRLNVTFEISNYDGLGDNAQWAKIALAKFQEVFEERQPLGLLTTHTFLPNMVMIGFTPENVAPDWGKLTIRATFQQVQQSTLETKRFTADKIQGEVGSNSTKPLGPSTPLSAQEIKKIGKKAVQVVKTKKEAFTPLTDYLKKQYGILK